MNQVLTSGIGAQELQVTLQNLHTWITTRDYAGYDPYDILNSPRLSAAWLRNPPMSFALIQFGKRFGGQRLRQILRVAPSKNPKAMGLILSACCDLGQTGQHVAQEARYLKSELKRLRSPNEPEYCWGYDWDYMGFRGTRLSAFRPNCIASYFCGTAMLDLAERLGDSESGEIGESVGRFLVSRLQRSVNTPEHLCLSYTPDDQTKIYNNSALAGAFLARLSGKTHNREYSSLARRIMNYLRDEQLPAGGWYYGVSRKQHWIDSFHTSYNLCALLDYRYYTGDCAFDQCIERGHAYFKQAFFTAEGAPKYFHDGLYPIDIHACAQAILHFCHFVEEDSSALYHAIAVYRWTLTHMAAEDGSFYYQRHRTWTNRTAYMRWGQAWMFRALSRLLVQLQNQDIVLLPAGV